MRTRPEMEETICRMDDRELMDSIAMLVRRGRQLEIAILLHLIEVENRRLHLAHGYSSMHVYCTDRLKMSDSGASRRVRAARCIRDYPEVFEMLANEELTLTTISMFAGSLNAENRTELLESVRGKTQKEVDRILCGHRNRPSVGDSMKPHRKRSKKNTNPGKPRSQEPADDQQPEPEPEEELVVKVQFEAGEEFEAKFRKMQELLSHRFPRGASFEEVFESAMDEFIDRHCPEKRTQRREARKASPRTSNGVSAKVRDRVLSRPGGCEYVGSDGRRCGSTWRLTVEHKTPRALGGGHSEEELSCFCARHNQQRAVEVFGAQKMAKYGVGVKTPPTSVVLRPATELERDSDDPVPPRHLGNASSARSFAGSAKPLRKQSL